MKYVGSLLLALFLCLSLQAQDQEEGFFVAHQCATSASLMIAKQKALLNTKGELATQINGKITSTDIDFQTRDNIDYLKYEGPTDPTITGSFGNIFTYKAFKLNVFITYSFGNVVRLNPCFITK